MLQNLGSTLGDSPETLIDADEYLQPKCRAPLPPGISTPGTSNSPPLTPLKPCWPNGNPLAADSPTPQNQQNWDRERFRYNSMHNNAASRDPCISAQNVHYPPSNGQCSYILGSEISSSRYCSDPLKMVIRGKLSNSNNAI